MKKLLILFCAGSILFAFTQPNRKPIRNQSIKADYRAAVRLTQNEFDKLVNDYQSAPSEKTIGGMISKKDLNNMILSMPSGDSYVNFRFATDDATGMVSLMLMGGKSWYEGKSKIDCLRNGGSAEAFCPSICDLNGTESNVTMDLDYNTFKMMSEAYKAANPSKTWGGNIDKNALMDLINSLPETTSNVVFRFCKDPVYGQTAVIFLGGKVNQPEGSVLYLRNGVTADAFCPSMCSIRD